MAMGSTSTAAASRPAVGLVLPGDRPAATVEFEARMVAFFVDAAELLGVPKSVAAIYGIVFASPEPLNFADIEARLDISKGSVSQGLRVLREVGALRVVSGEGRASSAENGEADSPAAANGSRNSSRDHYVPDLELRKLVTRFLEKRLGKQLSAGNEKLNGLKFSIPAGSAAATAELDRRLQSLQDWHKRARQLLPVAKAFLKLTPG